MFRDIRNGQLLKPILDKRGKRELRFYQLLFNESSQENQQTTKADHELIQRLRSFVPFFYGNEWLQQVQFIRLQDITQSMHQPNLMDIKIGRTTHDRLADEKKVQHELDKTTTNRTLGYRVLGVKVC